MRLLLMRHAPAQPGADEDSTRPLRAEARAALACPHESVQTLLGDVDQVLTSPWLRARQTAETLLPLCTGASFTQAQEALLPQADPQSFLECLLELPPEAVVLAVGHQPLVGRLVALLCDGAAINPPQPAPGELALIELDWPAAGLGRLLRWVRL